jgi:alkylation response protein AidB-like acyl-CoA dehydrogenase
MNFDFSEDQKLLQKTVNEYLRDNAPLTLARQVLESKSRYSETLWKGAAEMGWLGAAVPEEYGGSGFGHLELALIAFELGAALAPIPFASSVYLATEALMVGGSIEQKERLLPQLAAGKSIGTFALSEQAGTFGADRVSATFEDGRLNGGKVPVCDGDIADVAVVVALSSARRPILALTELNQAGVQVRPLDSIDPSRGLARVEFRDAKAELLGDGGDTKRLEHIIERAAVLMAFEQLGGAQRALEMTREYCMGRYAFGRPVASFQAIKHRLADLYVEIELARSNAYYGAWALSTSSDRLAAAAAGARATASDAFELAATEMIQLHGGVGFTWEFDCHLFYRRAKHLALALGTAAEWRERLVKEIAA